MPVATDPKPAPDPAPAPEPVEDLPVLFHQLWSYTMNEEDSAALQQLLESHGCLDQALQPAAPAAADDVDAAPAGADELVVPEFTPYPPKAFATQVSRAFKKAVKNDALSLVHCLCRQGGIGCSDSCQVGWWQPLELQH